MVTETLRKPIGHFVVIVHWYPREVAFEPIYWVKVCPMEAGHGRKIVFVGIEIDGSIVQVQADPRDVVLDGRA